jgi:ADP-ribose pyrophosphatase
MSGGARRTGHRRVYEGKVLSLDVDQVVEPGEVAATREVVRHQGSVATLAVDEAGRVALVRQYRYAVDEALWELPAGRRDGGEAPEAGARRELAEETGLTAGHLELLAEFFTTPGFCDERMYVYRATGLTPGEARPEADERIELRWFTPDEVAAGLKDGTIREGKTLVALLMEQARTAPPAR